MTGSVTFSTGIGGDGSTVTDDDNATTGLRDGGWRTRFVPCFTNQVSIANYVVTQANAASASATAAGSSATSAAAAYDSFDDRYLGAKASDPSVDNDGNALLTGALYWNSTSSVMKVYSGSAWSAAYVPSSGYLALTGGTMSGAITFAAGQFGTNVNTFLTTPTSANLAAALTDETGTGLTVFNNTPTLITPILGTPQSGNLDNCTFPTLNQNTTGTAATATNLASGSAGTIPYQSASGTTAMLAAGTSGQVLTSAGAGAPTWSTPAAATKTISNKTAAYTVVAGDLGKIINCTSGTFTVSLTAAASLGSGFTCTIWNANSGGSLTTITIDPDASETIGGKGTWVIRNGEGVDIVCNGTNWDISYERCNGGFSVNQIASGNNPASAAGNGAVAMGWNASAAGVNSVAIKANASSEYSVAIGNGAVMSGGYGVAIGYNASAAGGAGIAIGPSTVANADDSVAIGRNSSYQGSQATGAGAMALGGSYASGTDSFAAAIANNTSSYGATNTSAIAMGSSAKATGNRASAIGYVALASGDYSVAIGWGATASGYSSSIAIGRGATSSSTAFAVSLDDGNGWLATASGNGSVAIGQHSKSVQYGKYSFASGGISAQGDAQFGKIVLRAATSTPAVVLTSDGGAASTTNQLIVATGQSMAIQGTLIAKQSGSGNIAAWNITGAVSNNGGTLTSTGLALTLIGTDSIGLAAPTITLDTVNKAVKITSGSSGAQTRYVATLNTSEVTFA